MENIRSSSVEAHLSENIGSCDSVQSIDFIIQKLLNDTDTKWKKNTKIEDFDGNKMRKKEIRAPSKLIRLRYR